jgi:hypothetical protein
MNKSVVGGFVFAGVMVVLFGAVGLGIMRPYDRPEYAEIDTSESAFLIPLEGDTNEQASFQSVQFLEQRKVAAKRIQITHRWNQTGPFSNLGSWIPTVRLIKVDRRPVTREWTRHAASGTSSKDEAIHAESRDSINFSVGVACTANIPEQFASVFLYTYPSKSLVEMLDMEVRARIQQVIADEASKFDLDTLRAKKGEISAAIRADVIPFFRTRGIEIATIALVGGLHYENPEIQRAIDDAVKTTQLKVSAEARHEAQQVELRTLKLAAESKAAAAKLEAQSKADALKVEAQAKAEAELARIEAEAKGIRTLADARAYEVSKAGEGGALFVQLRQLDLEWQRWKQWDGRFPAMWISGGPTPTMPLVLPTLPLASAEKK